MIARFVQFAVQFLAKLFTYCSVQNQPGMVFVCWRPMRSWRGDEVTK